MTEIDESIAKIHAVFVKSIVEIDRLRASNDKLLAAAKRAYEHADPFGEVARILALAIAHAEESAP